MEQPTETPASSSGVVRRHRRMLADLGFFLNEKSRILDCGSGALVDEYRDAGYEAVGVDLERPGALGLLEDASFDFVFSTSGFERVADRDAFFSQVSRVLKPGGVSLHTFPPRYALARPRIAGWLAGLLGLAVWTVLRIDLGNGKLFDAARRHFGLARFVPHLWEAGDAGAASRRGAAIVVSQVYYWIYSNFHTVVLFLRK